MMYSFLPQSVPAFSATEVLNELRKKYPNYGYKEALLNPTNPRDRAVEWEADVVNRFRDNTELKEQYGVRDTPAGSALFFARPLTITDGACLQCHSTVDAAPKPMVDVYGPGERLRLEVPRDGRRAGCFGAHAGRVRSRTERLSSPSWARWSRCWLRLESFSTCCCGGCSFVRSAGFPRSPTASAWVSSRRRTWSGPQPRRDPYTG